MKKYVFMLVIAVAFMVICGTAGANVAKLTASDGAMDDWFGYSVSVSGDVAIVGAPYDDYDTLTDPGVVYIYRWNGTTWAEEQTLAHTIGADYDSFGYSVSVSGDVAIVGAQYDDHDALSEAGSAFIYRWDGVTWKGQQLIAADAAAGDNFGYSVSVSGDVAIVGATLANEDKGAAYIYQWNGTTWEQKQKLMAPDGEVSDYFGCAVSVSGDVAIVGAQWDDDKGENSGSAYIYRRLNDTTWVQEKKLTVSDGDDYDIFGWSVSVSGDAAIVGAIFDDDKGIDSGSAYIYRWDGTTWIEQELTASDGADYDIFGYSVSVSGDAAIVGAFGDDNDKGTNAGAAYIYRWNGTAWVEKEKLLASDGAGGDGFGHSVSVSGSAVIIGAQLDDTGTLTDSGSAYIYSCTYDISPTEKDYTAAGGTGSVAVTTSAWCDWTAVSNTSWIHITAGASGAGNGTVEYAVEPNVSADSRTGTMTIAGETFTVIQDGITSGGGGGGGCFINTLLH